MVYRNRGTSTSLAWATTVVVPCSCGQIVYGILYTSLAGATTRGAGDALKLWAPRETFFAPKPFFFAAIHARPKPHESEDSHIYSI